MKGGDSMEWSKKEKNFLMHYYTRSSNFALARVLRRSESSVRNQANRMGLARSYKKQTNGISCVESINGYRRNVYTYRNTSWR
jgi:hypothetical protein